MFTFQEFVGNAYKQQVYFIFANVFSRHFHKCIGIT